RFQRLGPDHGTRAGRSGMGLCAVSQPTEPDKSALLRAFADRYAAPPQLFSAPGRVNLIGEHTDYNSGWVLPIAIRERTWAAAAARSDLVVRAYSRQFGEEYRLSLADSAPPCRGKWFDYVEGMARVLKAR